MLKNKIAEMEGPMKKKKRYTWFYVIIVLFVFYFSFFYMERTEISDIDILLVLGIDQIEGGYEVTGLYNKNGGVDEATGGTKLIHGTGRTFYEAYNDLKQKNLKQVSIAHTTFYLFGEGATQSGMTQCLDYIERDQTVKMNAMIYMIRNETVRDFMQRSVDAKNQLNEQLNSISEKQFDDLTLVDNTIGRITESLAEQYNSLFIPYLSTEDEDIYVNGYAIIKHDQLIGYLNREESMTLDFLRNRARTYPIYLEQGVGLEITDSNVNSRVSIVNGKIVVHMEITFETDVKEVATVDQVYEDYYVNRLITQQNKYMSKQIDHMIHLANQYHLDLIDVTNQIRTAYVKDWDTISSNWNYYFSNITYEYNINSQAAQSYVVGN